MAKPNNQYSHVYDYFQRDEKNESYQCIETNNNGEIRGHRWKVESVQQFKKTFRKMPQRNM